MDKKVLDPPPLAGKKNLLPPPRIGEKKVLPPSPRQYAIGLRGLYNNNNNTHFKHSHINK